MQDNGNQQGQQGQQQGQAQPSQQGGQTSQPAQAPITTDRGANANNNSERKSLTERFNEEKK